MLVDLVDDLDVWVMFGDCLCSFCGVIWRVVVDYDYFLGNIGECFVN